MQNKHNIVFMKYVMRWAVCVGVVFFVFLLVIRPLRQFGMIRTFDDVQVVRVQAMVDELKNGQFPVRLVSKLGIGGGYMLFQFYPPLVYYIGAVFFTVGYPVVHATKLVFLLAYAVGAGGMMVLGYTMTRNKVLATLGAMMLITSAYFNFDAYSRGALAELMAFGLVPWVLWTYMQLRNANSSLRDTVWIPVSALSYAALVYAHTIIGFALAPFVALMCIWRPFSRGRWVRFGVSALVVFGLCASLLLPVMSERKYVAYDSTEYAQDAYRGTFRNFSQIFGSESLLNDFRAPSLGVGLAVGGLVSLIYGLWSIQKHVQGKKDKVMASHMQAILWSTILALFLMHPASTWVWERVSYLRFMQYPYRFLTVLTVYAILCVLLFLKLSLKSRVHRVIKIIVILGILTAPWIFQRQNFQPLGYVFVDTFEATGSCGTTTWQNELLPRWVEECLDGGGGDVVRAKSNAVKIQSISIDKGERKISFITNGKAGEVFVRKYYFPGWIVRTPSESFVPSYTTHNGLITFFVREGITEYRVVFTDTPVRKIGNSVTVGTAIAVAIYVIGWGVLRVWKRKQA
ncbi:MAG: hypothetical protein A2804_02965 [Candidatus Pacebacteria bacterium RIFCSPHIGHO2_01_FULL_46_10]|nr:MAG: hypothetical protein A2804_02965 [Candidatus Pacebacteria bacterium RIFCSPHIGHO2_01_FULL_46_10]